MSSFPTDEQLAQMTKELTQARIENWQATDLFTWQWWFILATLVIPWIIFCFIGDRKQLPKLILFGTLLMLITITLDLSGFEFGIWYYSFKLFPLGPLIAYIDISPLPIIYMLEYQYFPQWKDFIKVSFITGFVFSFCFEPILEALGLYTPIRWEHYYGLPFYILMPILMRMVVEKIYAISNEQ
ncbi:MAG: hypothetical protein H6Q72_1242 [Firmicutes bacterium]|nr:hypothetical protein [Bacillota bacterium]